MFLNESYFTVIMDPTLWDELILPMQHVLPSLKSVHLLTPVLRVSLMIYSFRGNLFFISGTSPSSSLPKSPHIQCVALDSFDIFLSPES